MAMKRENLEAVRGRGIGGYAQTTVEMPTKVEGKMIELDEETDAGMDELLAALGYKVRSSDMADVALKLEQLEMAMGSSAAQDDQLLSHLASDTVHYNPSDLSSWLESMLSEISPPAPQLQPAMHPNYRGYNLPPMTAHSSSAFFDPADTLATTESSTITSVDFCLPQARDARPDFAGRQNKAGVNRAALGSESAMETGSSRDRKRMRTSSSSSTSRAGSGSGGGVHGQSIQAVGTLPSSVCGHEVSSAMPVVMVDTQEVGIRLVHALMACAEAVQHENYKAADVLVKQISVLASSQGGAMRKVAGYFAEALARRIYRVHPSDCSLDSAFSDILQMHFYESCPYLKFAHFTANQAILEAFAGCRRVHVIDFSMKQGMQWPALMQALALRPGGPPSFRLTGIGPPQPDNTDALQQVGWKLAQLADTIHVDFEYRGFVANSLADLEPYMLDSLSPANNGSGEPEVVAINSVFELHGLLARPGALEKVLATVRAVKPRIVTIVEQEANHNTGPFMERFAEALHYYSTMFDSLEGGNCSGEGQHDQLMSEVYLGRQICSVVACEGAERTERHETLCQWRSRMSCAGFEPVHLGSNAFKQASMLLALFSGGDGYRVEEKEGCLTLGWHTRPLIATSAWRVVGPTDEPLSANAATDPH